MKIAIGFLALAFVLAGCSDEKPKGRFEQTTYSPHKGQGKLETTGDLANSFNLDSSQGDDTICGPTDEGFQIYIGPRDYIKDAAHGLHIVLPKGAKFPGKFVVNDVKPRTLFSYGLSEATGVWVPDRTKNDCIIDITQNEESKIGVKIKCPLEEFLLNKNQKLLLTADLQCNVINLVRDKE